MVDDVVAVGLLFAASFDDVDAVDVGFVEVVADGLAIDGVDLDGGGCDVDVGLLAADGVLGAAFGCDCCCCGFVSLEITGFVDDCLSDLIGYNCLFIFAIISLRLVLLNSKKIYILNSCSL